MEKLESNYAVISFYTLSALIIVFSLAMVITNKIIHSAVYLLFALLATAAYYFLLNADFIAVLQIFIYAGAITVLILFVIMLTLTTIGRAKRIFKLQVLVSVLVSSAFCLTLILATVFFSGVKAIGAEPADLSKLGELLFTKYLFPFELASVILLVALIGAVYLSKEEDEEDNGE